MAVACAESRCKQKEGASGMRRNEHGKLLMTGEKRAEASGRRARQEGKITQGGTAIPAQLHGLEGGRPDRLVGRHVHAARTIEKQIKRVGLRRRTKREREAAPQSVLSDGLNRRNKSSRESLAAHCAVYKARGQ